MEGLILIFAIISVIEIIIAICVNWRDEEIGIVILSSGITLLIVTIIFTISILIIGETKIESIEVYRGNSVLQITYQDSIPIDSVVVYKNK